MFEQQTYELDDANVCCMLKFKPSLFQPRDHIISVSNGEQLILRLMILPWHIKDQKH